MPITASGMILYVGRDTIGQQSTCTKYLLYTYVRSRGEMYCTIRYLERFGAKIVTLKNHDH